MTILSLIIVALLCEAIWETLKMIWQAGKFSWDKFGALVVSLIIAFASGADLFVIAEIPLKFPILGTICTGILVSRGSNYLHDLLKKIKPDAT
jgi:hypothetical protein